MRKALVTSLLLGLALFAPACTSSDDGSASDEAAATGPGGIDFLPAAIDGGKCHSTVLRGTSRFKGTAYVLPQVYLGTDADSRPLFHILKTPKGYLVTLGVYFPDGADDGSRNAGDNRNYKPDCRYDEIKERLNATVAASEKTTTVAPLIVNRITASLTGVGGEKYAFEIGNESTSILDFVGKDKLLNVLVSDEDSFKVLVALLRSTGLQVEFNFHFTAQASQLLRAKVDLSESSAAIDAAFEGAGGVSGAILQGELRTRLATALRSSKIEITVDGDAAFQQVADKIIDKLILSNPEIQLKPADVVTPPETKPSLDPKAPGTETAPPAASTEGAGSTSSTPASIIPRFHVSAAVAALKKQSTLDFELNISGAGTQQVYTTHATLRTAQTNAANEPILLTGAGPSESGKRVLQYENNIEAGDAFYIVPVSRRVEKVSYRYTSVDFKTKDEVLNPALNLSSRFPLLKQYPTYIKQKGDGVTPAWMYYNSWYAQWDWSYQTWGQETLTPGYSNSEFGLLAAESVKTMDYVQVAFSNSAGAPVNPKTMKPYGGVPLSMLVEEGKKRGVWDAVMDAPNNRVLFYAKQRLGTMTIANNEEFLPLTDTVEGGDARLYEKRYFQANWGSGGGLDTASTVYSNVGDALRLPGKRSSVKLQIVPVVTSLESVSAAAMGSRGLPETSAAAAPAGIPLSPGNVEIVDQPYGEIRAKKSQ